MSFGKIFSYAGKNYEVIALDMENFMDNNIKDIILKTIFTMKEKGIKKSKLEGKFFEGIIKYEGYNIIGGYGGNHYMGKFNIQGVSGVVDYSVMIVESINCNLN